MPVLPVPGVGLRGARADPDRTGRHPALDPAGPVLLRPRRP
jgi:hypothetical protein